MGGVISYDHLRSFGCIAYVHQMKEKTSARAVRGVFVGYEQGTKGYRVWLIDEKKLVISKDVVFNEKRFFKDLKKEESQEVICDVHQLKKDKKKVSFSDDLVEFEDEGSDQGGVHKADQEQEKKNTVGESSGTTLEEDTEGSESETDT